MPAPRLERLLLFHAHPDDEAINTGATMAHYAAAGAHVTLVTCTLGELGEILVPELAQLAAGQADQLGGYRLTELAAAMACLGVRDHRFLGGAGCWRDSGMLGDPGNADPRAFWACAHRPERFALAVAQARAVIEQCRPEVLITYDEAGGYGHPDHVMTHRVALTALRQAAEAAAARGQHLGTEVWLVTEGHTDICVDASAQVSAKRAALAAHATQVTVTGEHTFALSNGIARELSGIERYRRLADPISTRTDGAR